MQFIERTPREQLTLPATESVWGPTPSFFYRHILWVETELKKKEIKWCILGASDGKFVIPLVRRGYQVTAIDVDKGALFGTKNRPGLLQRLTAHRVEDRVRIVHANYAKYKTGETFDAVFTSGSLQYRTNQRFSTERLIRAIQALVAPSGILYLRYMGPTSEKRQSQKHLIPKNALRTFFDERNWCIMLDRVLPEFIDEPHLGEPRPHKHRFGYFRAKRLE